ncbi:DUF2207 domain-containing protein [Rhizobium sp. FKY42]|uniref:DUF2207 domain-containing protein n=1 Tax=Rhizobium sp. FKY42 TaxID=2562310 RepID=UPI0010C15889|nr:DUF2207 domain-containing protein [Rhizobium sp. FKY42]
MLQALGVGMSGAAWAAEYIAAFRSEIQLSREGDVTVTEIITVNAEGKDIRRGIFRDFPLYMVDAKGKRQKVGFEVLTVTRDGRPENWRTEGVSGGVRIYLGSADTQLDRGLHTYELTYRTDRQIRYQDSFDEFYWNVTGNGWMFRIDQASAVVQLPPGVKSLNTTFFTGAEGATGKDARRTGSDTAPGFVTVRPLSPNEGLTIAIAMPKGSIMPPSDAQQRGWFWRDNINFIIGGITLAVVGLYYLWFWRRVGRDPPRGVVVPRWHPPEGLSPALVNYVDNKGFSGEGWDALSASFIDLAVGGYVVLEDLKSSIVVRRTGKAAPSGLPAGQAILLQQMGAKGEAFTIDKANGTKVQSVGKLFRNAIEKEHRGRYYKSNIGYVVVGVLLSILALAALLFFGDFDPDSIGFLVPSVIFGAVWGGFALNAGRSLFRKRSVLARIGGVLMFGVFGFIGLIAAGGLLVAAVEALDHADWPVLAVVGGITLINAIFFFLMGAPTPLGAKLMDEVEGLRIYLTLAEKDRMNMVDVPEMSPRHFETLLPYAVALGVEKPWSRTFETWLATAAAGATAASYHPGWYSGDSFGSFGDSIGGFSSSMASTIASTIPQPVSSSSSGFSSGGSSGGGGGGGGGGGW